MTTAESKVDLVNPENQCPEWCQGHGSTPPSPTDSHFCDEEAVVLTLVKPEAYEDSFTGAPTWHARTARVYLDQRSQAYQPVIRVDTGDGLEDQVLVMTLSEGLELSLALKAAFDRAYEAINARIAKNQMEANNEALRGMRMAAVAHSA